MATYCDRTCQAAGWEHHGHAIVCAALAARAIGMAGRDGDEPAAKRARRVVPVAPAAPVPVAPATLPRDLLVQLPPEMIVAITEFLPLPSIVALMRVNQQARALMELDVWRLMILRDFVLPLRAAPVRAAEADTMFAPDFDVRAVASVRELRALYFRAVTLLARHLSAKIVMPLLELNRLYRDDRTSILAFDRAGTGRIVFAIDSVLDPSHERWLTLSAQSQRPEMDDNNPAHPCWRHDSVLLASQRVAAWLGVMCAGHVGADNGYLYEAMHAFFMALLRHVSPARLELDFADMSEGIRHSLYGAEDDALVTCVLGIGTGLLLDLRFDDNTTRRGVIPFHIDTLLGI